MPTSALAPAPEAEAAAGLVHLPAGELSAASRLADEAADAIAAAPKDYAAHARVLHDLKLALVELADRGEAPAQAEEQGNEAAPAVDATGDGGAPRPHAGEGEAEDGAG
ncbi:MAG: hypothetical protein K2N07_02425, partial [Desulfovibrio sp.]|nr:hypothetical protein [Desulfovibrio sp.]